MAGRIFSDFSRTTGVAGCLRWDQEPHNSSTLRLVNNCPSELYSTESINSNYSATWKDCPPIRSARKDIHALHKSIAKKIVENFEDEVEHLEKTLYNTGIDDGCTQTMAMSHHVLHPLSSFCQTPPSRTGHYNPARETKRQQVQIQEEKIRPGSSLRARSLSLEGNAYTDFKSSPCGLLNSGYQKDGGPVNRVLETRSNFISRQRTSNVDSLQFTRPGFPQDCEMLNKFPIVRFSRRDFLKQQKILSGIRGAVKEERKNLADIRQALREERSKELSAKIKNTEPSKLVEARQTIIRQFQELERYSFQRLAELGRRREEVESKLDGVQGTGRPLFRSRSQVGVINFPAGNEECLRNYQHSRSLNPILSSSEYTSLSRNKRSTANVHFCNNPKCISNKGDGRCTCCIPLPDQMTLFTSSNNNCLKYHRSPRKLPESKYCHQGWRCMSFKPTMSYDTLSQKGNRTGVTSQKFVRQNLTFRPVSQRGFHWDVVAAGGHHFHGNHSICSPYNGMCKTENGLNFMISAFDQNGNSEELSQHLDVTKVKLHVNPKSDADTLINLRVQTSNISTLD